MTARLPYVQQNRKIIEGKGHDAQEWRWMQAGIGPAGVCGSGDLKVTPKAAMQVQVAAGSAFIEDDAGPFTGLYHVVNDAAATVDIEASHQTLGRKDIVIAEVLDTAFGSSSDEWRVRSVSGTAASTPVAPSVPARALLLAEINVTAGLGAVAAANITEKRVPGGGWAAPRGIVHAETLPSKQSNGERAIIIDKSMTLPSGRYYVATLQGVVIFANADAAGDIRYYVSGAYKSAIWQGRAITAGNSFGINSFPASHLVTGTSPSFKMDIARTVGTGAMTLDSQFSPIIFQVVDMGGGVL